MQTIESIDQFFSLKKPKAFSNRIMLICGVLAAIEAMDIYVLGVIISPMSKSFGVSLATFAIVFTFQAIGQIFGTYAIAPLSDKFGRRPVILYCTIAFGILTMTAALSPSLPVFIAQRLLAFIFIGGAVPNIFAIASETGTGNSRPRNALVIGSFHGIGAGFAALLGGFLVPYGWQAPLVACGALSLLSAVVTYFFVPESLRFLAANEKHADALKAAVKRIDPSVESFRFAHDPPSPTKPKIKFAELFEPKWRRSTFLLWTIGAITLSLLSSVAQWLPTYLHLYGDVSLKQAAIMTSINGPSGVLWPLVLIWLMRRIGISRAMALNYSLATLAFGCFVLFPLFPGIGWLLAFGLGAFLGGATSGFYAMCNNAYPTRILATGTSFAVGAGRIFSLFVPLLGGLAASALVAPGIITLAITIPLSVAALAAFLLGRGKAPDLAGR